MPSVGLDFGTSNSSTSLFDGHDIHLYEIDPRNDNPRVLPSYIYITDQREQHTGREAMDLYLENDTGRPVKWERRKVGEVEVTVAGPGGEPLTYIEDLIAEIDTAARGRLVQSVKTALRDPHYTGTQIFASHYELAELIALLLGALRTKAEGFARAEVDRAVIGRPVRFSHDAQVDARAQETIEQAAHLAGFHEVSFELEPVAAAHVYHQTARQRETVLVFDFGGGTLDLTVVEVGAGLPPHVLATQGVLVGGDDLDKALMRHLLRYFGDGSTVAGGPFPGHVLGLLNDWQSMLDLSRPQFRRLINELWQLGSDRQAVERMVTLVSRNLGFRLFQELERVKLELSRRHSATVHFEHENIHIHEQITRVQFERLIGEHITTVSEALDEVLGKASLPAAAIHAVLRTGGSSAVPAFVDLLQRKFNPERVREMNPFTTIVGGLGIQAASLWPDRP